MDIVGPVNVSQPQSTQLPQFKRGKRSIGFNEDNKNKIQSVFNGSAASDNDTSIEVFESTSGTHLLDVSKNSTKIRTLNADGTQTELVNLGELGYGIKDGSLLDNFNEGKPNNAQGETQEVNLLQGKELDTIEAGTDIKQTVNVGSVNETSDNNHYFTEAFFKGKDGKTIGIGVVTKDDTDISAALNEYSGAFDDFTAKLEDISKMAESFNCGDEITNYIKGLDSLQNEENTDNELEQADKFTKALRDTAQKINDVLRNKVSGNDETKLNDFLKSMVRLDASMRDFKEETINSLTELDQASLDESAFENFDKLDEETRTALGNYYEQDMKDKTYFQSEVYNIPEEQLQQWQDTIDKVKDITLNFTNPEQLSSELNKIKSEALNSLSEEQWDSIIDDINFYAQTHPTDEDWNEYTELIKEGLISETKLNKAMQIEKLNNMSLEQMQILDSIWKGTASNIDEAKKNYEGMKKETDRFSREIAEEADIPKTALDAHDEMLAETTNVLREKAAEYLTFDLKDPRKYEQVNAFIDAINNGNYAEVKFELGCDDNVIQLYQKLQDYKTEKAQSSTSAQSAQSTQQTISYAEKFILTRHKVV